MSPSPSSREGPILAKRRPFPRLGFTPWERLGLALLLVVGLLFGVLVEMRSAYLQRRMGDLGVFLRTAWAVRTGENIYTVTDNNGYHYHYPPLFAVLLVPLADPPPGAERSWTVPYPLTVALWYALSLLCLVIAVHWLASAVEQTTRQGDKETRRQGEGASPGTVAGGSSNSRLDPATGPSPRLLVSLFPGLSSRWVLRVLPVLACLPPIGHTLMRGQVSLLLLLLLCGMAAALLRGRRRQAGLWLAGSICLKVIPAFLVLYPLHRRDGRCLAGCAAGLLVGMVLIPVAVFGPARTLTYYQEWAHVLLWPALGPGTDQSRAKELIEVTATDSQSFQAIIHNTIYPNPATRPPQASVGVRCAHWLIGGFLTLMTLLVARRRDDGPAAVITLGALTVIMILLSPVCHLHYFCLSLPLVTGLLAAVWEEGGSPLARMGMYAVLVVYGVANALPHFLKFQLLRDCGLATYAALLLWLVGMVILWKRPRSELALPLDRPEMSGAAA